VRFAAAFFAVFFAAFFAGARAILASLV